MPQLYLSATKIRRIPKTRKFFGKNLRKICVNDTKKDKKKSPQTDKGFAGLNMFYQLFRDFSAEMMSFRAFSRLAI